MNKKLSKMKQHFFSQSRKKTFCRKVEQNLIESTFDFFMWLLNKNLQLK